MKTSTKKIVDNFERENRLLWGDKFFILTKDNKVTLMTEGLVKKLKDLVGDTDEITITSLDKDESVGQYFRVKKNLVTHLHHYHRDQKEIDRSLQNLPSKDMITIDYDDGRMVIKNELMAGELFRGVILGNWIAAVVYHDYVSLAPKVIGWVKYDDFIEKTSTNELTRPEKLFSLDEIVDRLTGLPYHLGGKSYDKGFDCSSMTQWIFFHLRGIWLPKLSAWQALIGEEVSKESSKQGDLVFFERGPGWTIEHVGIVYNNERGDVGMFHASANKRQILVEKLEPLLARQPENGFRLKTFRRVADLV